MPLEEVPFSFLILCLFLLYNYCFSGVKLVLNVLCNNIDYNFDDDCFNLRMF